MTPAFLLTANFRIMTDEKDLTKGMSVAEVNFCRLYAGGVAPYAGNPAKSHEGAFGKKSLYANVEAAELLQRDDVKAYVGWLRKRTSPDSDSVKQYLTQTYMRIIDECSEAEYTDRKGLPLNPASMRSVAVNAAKALAELHIAKETKVSIGGEGGKNGPSVTFNVIVPGAQDGAKVEVQREKEGGK